MRKTLFLIVSFFLIVSPAYAANCASISSNLAYWKLDETSGTSASDFTGNGNTGTLQTNTAFTSAGKINFGVIQSSASAVGVVVGTNADLDLTTYPLSVSAWFKTTRNTSVPNGQMMIYSSQQTSGNFSRYTIGLNPTTGFATAGYIDSTGGGSTITSSGTTYNDGAWHLMTFTIDSSGSMVLYVDNVSKATGTVSTALGTGKKATIGINWDVSTNDPWYGSLDEVGVWGCGLSSTQVTQIWNGGSGIQYPFVLTVTPGIQMIWNGVTGIFNGVTAIFP